MAPFPAAALPAWFCVPTNIIGRNRGWGAGEVEVKEAAGGTMCHGGSTRLSATLLGQTAWLAVTRTDAEFGENGAKS